MRVDLLVTVIRVAATGIVNEIRFVMTGSRVVITIDHAVGTIRTLGLYTHTVHTTLGIEKMDTTAAIVNKGKGKGKGTIHATLEVE